MHSVIRERNKNEKTHSLHLQLFHPSPHSTHSLDSLTDCTPFHSHSLIRSDQIRSDQIQLSLPLTHCHCHCHSHSHSHSVCVCFSRGGPFKSPVKLIYALSPVKCILANNDQSDQQQQYRQTDTSFKLIITHMTHSSIE